VIFTKISKPYYIGQVLFTVLSPETAKTRDAVNGRKNKIWVRVDETTDGERRTVANFGEGEGGRWPVFRKSEITQNIYTIFQLFDQSMHV